MYIRKTSRKNKDGSKVTYLQLAHNVWDPIAGCAKAKVLYSFGREDQLDPDAIERLAMSLSRFLSPQKAAEVNGQISMATDFVFQASKSLGSVWALDQLWHEMGIDSILKDLFEGRKHQADLERLLFAMVANRAVHPTSKLAMEEWVEDDVHIPGLESVSSHQLYRAMDELMEVREELEKQVYFATADLMNLEVDLLYFDTTSSYFEVTTEETPSDELFRLTGLSKDKRPDLVQVVIGLAVTREGIPIRVWVWPGNTPDMNVVEEVKKDLVGWKLGRVISVMDRGFSSEKNLRMLQRAGGHFIVGEKMRSGKETTELALARAGRFKEVSDSVHVKEITVGDGEKRKRFVLVYNPSEARRKEKRRQKHIENLEAMLQELRQMPGEAHTKTACQLRTHPTYGRYLRQLKDGRLKINRAAIKEEERLDGKYLIQTSDDTLSAEDVALGYKQLLEVEDCFRTIKTPMSLRPMYHRRDERIKAHVVIAWLALLLARILEVRTGDTWRNIRTELGRVHLIHASSKTDDVFQTTALSPKQRALYQKSQIKPPPTIIQIKHKP